MSDREQDVASEAVFYALFRVVEVEELSGPERAVDWARGLVEDGTLRRAFADGVLRNMRRREESGEATGP